MLIEADSAEDAAMRAGAIGKSREHEYQVAEPEPHVVRWEFVGAETICEIEGDTLDSGTELFSRFLRESEALSLRQPFD